jgi:hypothetical protein
MKFLLDEDALRGLSQPEQEVAKDKALGQFLLGSIFGGQGLSSGYQAVQNIIPTMQKQKQQQGLLQELAGIQQDFFPTEAQAGQRALAAEGKGPTVTAAENQRAILQQPVDTGAALTRLGRLATNPNATQMLPGLTKVIENLQPKLQEGLFIGPGGNIMGAAPKVDIKTGTVTRGSMKDGQLDFSTDVLPGAKRAQALNTLPELEKGQEYVFDANQNVVGVRDAAGVIQSLQAREAAVVGAREMNIPRATTSSTGVAGYTFVTPPSMRAPSTTTQGGQGGGQAGGQTGGQPSGGGFQGGGLTTAQAALNESYKPILTDAYAGYKIASQRSGTLQQLQTALNNPNFDTSAFAPAKTAITSFLNASGVTGDNAKQFLASAASMRQGLNTLASQSVSELPGAISNFEIGFAQNRFGTITDTKESNKYAIDLMQEADKRKKEYYNFVSNPRNAGPDVIQKWENSPQGQKSLFEAPTLRKYLPQLPVTSGPDKGKTAYQMPNGKYRVYD